MSQEQGAAASGAGSMVERTPAHVLRALSEAARSVMHAFRLRPDGTACFSFADPRIFDVYGLKPDVVAADATPIMQRIHPDDLAMLQQKQEESRRTLATFEAEFRYAHDERGEIWVEVRSTPLPDPDGGVTWYGFLSDVTERKRKDAALIASEDRFKKLFELAPVGISLAVNRTMVEANAALVSMLRTTREELIGRTYESVGSPTPTEKERRLRQIEDTGQLPTTEISFGRKDGSFGRGLVAATTIEMDGQKYVMMVTLDVSANREMEARLRASNDLNRAVLQNIPGGYVTVVDHDYRFLLAEGSLLSALGLGPLVGKTVSEVVDAETAATSMRGYGRTLSGEAFEGEVPYLGRILRTQQLPLRDADGKVYAALNLAIDVTAQRQAERDLRKLSDELESRVAQRTAELSAANQELEAFTYSVSHDLRAPLRSIQGFAQAVLEDYAQLLPEDGQKHLSYVQRSAIELAKLLDELLALSRLSMSPLTKDVVDMNALVRRCLDELRPRIEGRKLEIVVSDLPPCDGDAGLLRHVFQNLLSNAVKYTSRRETAHITVKGTIVGDTVTYDVTDDGAGFDMRYAHRLFVAFQRLHRAEEFEGTGVGLAIVRRLVTRHGGTVSAEGERGRGATFHVTLPRAQDRKE